MPYGDNRGKGKGERCRVDFVHYEPSFAAVVQCCEDGLGVIVGHLVALMFHQISPFTLHEL